MYSSKNFERKSNLRNAIAAIVALGTASVALVYTSSAAAQEEKAAEVTELSDVNVTDDPLRTLSNEPSGASFGFAKPLLETPRTVTFVSEEQLRLYGVSSVDDLSRLVPGTYTTTRYGLQGGINVRGVSADFYYRGMKRLQMQGHVRTVLSAYDNIEVIKGPPSPLYGMGQIGGYANLDPKSNRAKTGKYMTQEQGYLQATVDSYGKGEMQFGLGKPFELAGKAAGIYVVGLLEDSKTFVENVPAKQKFLQATLSVDNAIGPFRLETGGQVQNSVTAGAYFARTTQDFVDNGTYITGRPMANLDLNGDGRIGYVETYLGSPITGSIGGNNQALDQRFTLPQDAAGNPIPISSYANTINGIPKAMMDYLTIGPGANSHCAMADYMRTQPVIGATSNGLVTRNLPVGLLLDPCNTGETTLEKEDYRANGAYEREQNATQKMAYFDLIYDTDPDFTIKNQLFYDSLNSFKDSWLPYGENQFIKALEDKITVTKKVSSEVLPDWLAVNSLASVNYRKTSGFIRSSGGDFDFRQDITFDTGANGSGTGGFYPNTMFWTQLTNNSYQYGVPNSNNRHSKYTEKGIGVMLDIDFFTNTNLVLGGRYDDVNAQVNESPLFNPNTGTIGLPTPELIAAYKEGTACLTPGGVCPGAYLPEKDWVEASDNGTSWSASLSHKLPWYSMTPYVTVASSTITLDGNNNLYAAATVTGAKLVGDASLKEYGIKGVALGKKMQWTLASFEQERTDVSGGADPSIAAFATSTTTKGVEASINYQATRNWFIGASIAEMDPRYSTGAVALNIGVTARELGFKDYVAPDGSKYPAEAFGFGGRTNILLNDPNNVYDKVPGSPETQAAMNTSYNLGKGFGILANVQYFGESWANRIQTVKLPSSTIINLGVTWDNAKIHLKGNVYNLDDDIDFRAGNGGNSMLMSVMPGRRYELSLKVDL
ncbi:MAG: TonB-dependent receptor [Gammaproteobacteria bacterium]|nr:MAG: TonB-dependent receptor [Gammaproteobacteria bacterium]